MPIDDLIAEPLESDELVDAEIEAGEGDDAGENEEIAADDDTTGEEVVGDGRVIPKYIKDLQASDPKGYKKAKEAFFQHRDFIAAFPEGPNAASRMLQTIADAGGAEGIATLQQQAAQLSELAQLARTNPAAVLQQISAAAPDRAEDVAVAAIGNWYQNNPESYDRMMAGVVAQSLKNIDFDSMMYRAQVELEVNRPENALAMLNQIREKVAGFGATATAAPKEQRQTQQRTEATAQSDLDTFKAQAFDEKLGGAIVAFRDPMIFREAEQWTKGMTLNDRQKGSLVRDVTESIGQMLQKDADFMRSYQAVSAKRDAEGALKLYQDKAAKIGPSIVKDVARELFGSPVSAAKKAPVVVKATAKVAPSATTGRREDKFDAIWNS